MNSLEITLAAAIAKHARLVEPEFNVMLKAERDLAVFEEKAVYCDALYERVDLEYRIACKKYRKDKDALRALMLDCEKRIEIVYATSLLEF